MPADDKYWLFALIQIKVTRLYCCRNEMNHSNEHMLPSDLNGNWTPFKSRFYPKHFTVYASYSPVHTHIHTALAEGPRRAPTSSTGAVRVLRPLDLS